MSTKTSQKKILLYTRPLSPPWDEASKNLAHDIAEKSMEDFDFHILTADDKKNVTNKSSTLNKKITTEKIYTSPQFNFMEKMQLLKRLFRFKINANVIHFLFTPRSLTSSLIRFRLFFSKTKTIQTIATLNEKSFQTPKKLKKILFADKIIAQSNYTYDKLKKAGFNNLKLIYPGISLEKFQPTEKNQELLSQFNINNDDFTVLFAGEYTRLKAIDDIINAFQIINKNSFFLKGGVRGFSDNSIKKSRTNLAYKLILACRIKSKKDKIKKEEIIKKTKELGFFNKIIFIDTFTNMPLLYNISDLNIFPVQEMSGKFDIPLAIIEAMACKKPVIISDIPVLMEFIKNDETGIVVPKANPEKLAEEIIELMNDKEKMSSLAENGLNFVKENFDIEKNVEKYDKIYKKL